MTRFALVWFQALSMALIAAACGNATSAEQDPDRSGTATASPITLAPTEGSLEVDVNGVGIESPAENVLLVGDSVLVLVADDLANSLDARIYVDSADCRRLDSSVTGPCGGVPSGAEITDGITALQTQVERLNALRVRPDAAVVVLANNATVTEELLDSAMEALGDVPQVFWVNTRIEGFGRQDINNAELDALAERNERALIVDWFAASEGRDWLADNVHPNEEGQTALADLIVDHIQCECVP